VPAKHAQHVLVERGSARVNTLLKVLRRKTQDRVVARLRTSMVGPVENVEAADHEGLYDLGGHLPLLKLFTIRTHQGEAEVLLVGVVDVGDEGELRARFCSRKDQSRSRPRDLAVRVGERLTATLVRPAARDVNHGESLVALAGVTDLSADVVKRAHLQFREVAVGEFLRHGSSSESRCDGGEQIIRVYTLMAILKMSIVTAC
jgi:hypothetical protein